MSAMTARERVRAELTREITGVGRRHLAEAGAAGLSLRAVAREMGMASSAIYRYFPSRDELLTALIVESYDAVGEAAEHAEGAIMDRADLTGRWLAACRAVREWALVHPHEYALVYGSPVPGYRAPAATIAPASRVGALLAGILRDGMAADVLQPLEATPLPAGVLDPGVTPLFGGDSDLHRTAAARGITAWTHLFGAVSFELFGHLENVVTDRVAFFDAAALAMATLVGLPGPSGGEPRRS